MRECVCACTCACVCVYVCVCLCVRVFVYLFVIASLTARPWLLVFFAGGPCHTFSLYTYLNIIVSPPFSSLPKQTAADSNLLTLSSLAVERQCVNVSYKSR